jgi:hypothetical protein
MTDLPENSKKCIFCAAVIDYVKRGDDKPPGTNELVGMPIGSTCICTKCTEELFNAMENEIKKTIPEQIDKIMEKKEPSVKR